MKTKPLHRDINMELLALPIEAKYPIINRLYPRKIKHREYFLSAKDVAAKRRVSSDINSPEIVSENMLIKIIEMIDSPVMDIKAYLKSFLQLAESRRPK